MKIKTSDLIGSALDWAVAKCERVLPCTYDDWCQVWPFYSTNWSQSGPIIEREKIGTREWDTPKNPEGWWAGKGCGEPDAPAAEGPTPLIAAMRCYVASKLGNEVDIPEELL